jgi:hypothetical protein
MVSLQLTINLKEVVTLLRKLYTASSEFREKNNNLSMTWKTDNTIYI